MRLRASFATAALFALALASAGHAEANWLTKLVDAAGDAGGGVTTKALRHADPDIGRALNHVEGLPKAEDTLALAVDAGSEGHLKFATRTGETFTAATPQEMARMTESLAPGHTGKMALYMTPETLFADRTMLDALPPGAELNVVTKTGSGRVVITDGSARIEVRPKLMLQAPDALTLEEAMFQLGRAMSPKSVRVVALEPKGADALNRVPGFDAATKTALVDSVDPASLPAALASVSGQTVVVSGKVADGQLAYSAASGATGRMALAALRDAARAADVNLVVVKAGTARQPGGRNWLWQTVGVPGMSEAMKQAKFADFLATLAGRETALTVKATLDPYGRAVIEAVPNAAVSLPVPESWTGWLDAVSGEVMGNIAIAGIEADMRGEERQRELDFRIVPFVPSMLQWGYLILAALALFGPFTAWRWWSGLWPPEDRKEYGSLFGFAAARLFRGLFFVLVFMPVVGLPIALRYLGLQAWTALLMPWRVIQWLRSWYAPRTT